MQAGEKVHGEAKKRRNQPIAWRRMSTASPNSQGRAKFDSATVPLQHTTFEPNMRTTSNQQHVHYSAFVYCHRLPNELSGKIGNGMPGNYDLKPHCVVPLSLSRNMPAMLLPTPLATPPLSTLRRCSEHTDHPKSATRPRHGMSKHVQGSTKFTRWGSRCSLPDRGALGCLAQPRTTSRTSAGNAQPQWSGFAPTSAPARRGKDLELT